jgi:hypothetical protein
VQRGRTLRIAAAIGWLIWTSAIVPGHTRGCVPLSAVGIHNTSHCCSRKSNEKPVDEKRPPTDCAICFLAAQLNAPTTLPSPRLDLFDLRSVVESVSVNSHESHPALAYLCRGPPALI